MPSPRLLIIGIDGGTFDVIDPLVAAGKLPHLGALLRRAASARTACTWPAHTAPGWSSFVSASNPGGHGIYQFYDTQDPGYGAVVRQARDLGRSSVWDWLARQGYTLGLINIPMSHPPRELPGYQVTWPLEHTLRYCRPHGVLAELTRGGAHFQPDLATMFRGDLGYIDEAVANVAARLRSAEYLMTARPTDVVMVVFTEVDRVCHHYWHFCDPSHPRHVAAPEQTGWDKAIERIYTALDAAIGELVALLADDATIVVVSDHGLGTGRYRIAVHAVLESAGLLATAAAPEHAGAIGPASWFRDSGREVDFTRTKVYSPVPGCYGLNANLAGRQHEGTVTRPDQVLEEAAAVLGSLTLPDTGEPAFRAIVPREAGYPGPHMSAAPDLLLIPRDESVIVTSDLSDAVWGPSWQTGLHRYSGMWIQASPRTRPGRLAAAVPLVDLVPTLLVDLGAAWPSTVHGMPVMAAFDRELPIPAHGGDGPQDEPAAALPGPKDARAAEDLYTSQRLREMGYL